MSAANKVETYTATIHVGLQEKETGHINTIEDVYLWCQDYVERVGLCVSVKPTMFVYTGGSEPGAEIGMINYPRFPSEKDDIRQRATELAAILLRELKQQRVSVVFPDGTIMLTAGRQE